MQPRLIKTSLNNTISFGLEKSSQKIQQDDYDSLLTLRCRASYEQKQVPAKRTYIYNMELYNCTNTAR